MPRYHYSRSTSTSNDSDSTLIHDGTDDRTDKLSTSATNDQQTAGGTFQSTFVPFLPTTTTTRLMNGQKREFIQIPITREDNGVSSPSSSTTISTNIRTVPITLTSETTNIIPLTNQTNGNHFLNLLRPNSRYFQQQTPDESSTSFLPRLNLVPRRSSLTLPVMTAATATVTNSIPTDEIDGTKVTIPTPTSRQIPIRLVSPNNNNNVNTNNNRISSAVPRLAPLNSNGIGPLQRQKADFDEVSSPSSFISNSTATSDFSGATPSIRRAEVIAREAIQGLARQQHQQRNQTLPMTTNNSNRSPSLSRRVIINLQNNQSVLLDSRLSSSKPPVAPTPLSSSSSSSSTRSTQKNNLFYIPVLHEIQMPSDPKSSSTNGNFKNEFHMEIPVNVVTTTDQENRLDQQNESEFRFRDRRASTSNSHPNPTLKSILKRSSSRDNVPRKNVSFMNT